MGVGLNGDGAFLVFGLSGDGAFLCFGFCCWKTLDKILEQKLFAR